MYMRTVAPTEPVPDSLKMTRDPSAKRRRTPWFAEYEPSTGSVYANSSTVERTKPLCAAPPAPKPSRPSSTRRATISFAFALSTCS